MIPDAHEHVGWIGVDFDATLAEYHGWEISKGAIGRPIPRMVARVKQWLKEGKTVKIVTARANQPLQVDAIKAWLVENGLPALEVTNAKDYMMYQLWDDRAIQVNPNTGETVDEEVIRLRRELKRHEDLWQRIALAIATAVGAK